MSLAHLSLSSLDCQTAKIEVLSLSGCEISRASRLALLLTSSSGELLQSLPARHVASVVTGSNKWAGKGAARVEKVALPF